MTKYWASCYFAHLPHMSCRIRFAYAMYIILSMASFKPCRWPATLLPFEFPSPWSGWYTFLSRYWVCQLRWANKKPGKSPAFKSFLGLVTRGSRRRRRRAPLRGPLPNRSGVRGRSGRGLGPRHRIPLPHRPRGSGRPPPGR